MTSSNYLKIISTLALLWLPTLDAVPEPPVSWFDTIGTHYRLDTESWIGTTRDIPAQGNVGFDPDITNLAPENIAPTRGHFSGELRYYNFNGLTVQPGPGAILDKRTRGLVRANEATLDADGQDAVESASGSRQKRRSAGNKDYLGSALNAERAGINLLWHTGQVSVYTSPSNVELLMAKKGAYFKDNLYALYLAANTGPLEHRKTTLYWEIGNEINSSQRFSLRDLTNGQYVEGHPGHAHDYVEYYLAPAVEALRAAAADLYGDPNKVTILIGSVSGIIKTENQQFLDLVLNHTIEGDHAPSLTGRKVYEVIDAASIHYSLGDRYTLQTIYNKWIGSGKVSTLWSTEELGTRGHGDYTAALVSSRWLKFVLTNDWPSGHSGRAIFWGDDSASRHPADVTGGADMLHEIGSVLRDAPLRCAEDSVEIKMRADFEWYAFSAGDPEKPQAFAIYLKPYPTTQPALLGVTIKLPSTMPRLENDDVRLRAFVPTIGKATRSISPHFTIEQQQIEIQFEPRWEMPIDEALQLLIEIKTPSDKR